MEDNEDPIRELLKNTGWSCDDLLEKLQKFKSGQVTSQDKKCVFIQENHKNSDANDLKVGQSSGSTDEDAETTKNNDYVRHMLHQSSNNIISDEDEDDAFIEECYNGNSDIISNIEKDDPEQNINQNIESSNDISNYNESSNSSNKNIISQSEKESGNQVQTENSNLSITSVVNAQKSNNTEKSIDCNDKSVSRIGQNTIDANKNHDSSSRINNTIDSSIPNSCIAKPLSHKISDKSPKYIVIKSVTYKAGTVQANDNKKINIVSDIPVRTASEKSKEVILKKSVIHQMDSSEDKIEHKLQNIIPVLDKTNLGDVEENKNERTFTETETNSAFDTLEDIRNNLKAQLTCLRTKKKDSLLNNITKKVDFTVEGTKIKLNENAVKKGLPNDETENKEEASEYAGSNNTTNSKNFIDVTPNDENLNNSINHFQAEDLQNEESCLYTQTNEFGIVIASVQGGIEIDEPEKSEDKLEYVNEEKFVDENNEASKEVQVIDEIRKIINKEKPSFPKIFVRKEFTKIPDHFLDADEKPGNNSENDTTSLSGMQSYSSEKDPLENIITGDPVETKPNNDNDPIINLSSPDPVENISPFVSNTLDEFLTEEARLNISYNVPKCGAEDGLKGSLPEEGPLVLKKVVKVREPNSTSSKQFRHVKAKTVAQKRKLLEKEKMKHNKKYLDIKEEKHTESTDTTTSKSSYVLLGDKKIWVNSQSDNKCVAVISASKPIRKDVSTYLRPRKLLLKETQKINHDVKYKPGPLCKKGNLQISGLDNWETELKTLPKIYLEVYPQVGHTMPCHVLQRIPELGGDLSSLQIDLALSAVKIKNGSGKIPDKIVIPLKYHNNQEQVAVRKKKMPVCHYNFDKAVTSSKTGENVISDVIEELIKYVEIRELAPSLIKDDEIQLDAENDAKEVPTMENDNVSVIRKRQKKKSKVDLELLRLNCKLVNVEVEEKEDDTPCKKSYCQLGCVCNSLKCENVSSYHCQKLNCMFECTCPKEKAWAYDHKFTLPAGSDILSTDTVTRIEDEAKKNLAKVEREFTQTIIYANDKTIVVGLGGRNKSRRAPKVPKKFDDYINISESVENLVQEKSSLRECKVSLPKFNFSDIQPYCLQHSLYDCHCKYLSSYTPTTKSVFTNDLEKSPRDDQSPSKMKYSRKIYSSDDDDIFEPPKTKKQYSQLESIEQQPGLSNCQVKPRKSQCNKKRQLDSDENEGSVIKSKRIIKKRKVDTDFEYFEEGICARIRGIDSRYEKKTITELVFKNDFVNNVNDSDILKAKLKSNSKVEQLKEADILKLKIIEDNFDLTKASIKDDKNRKRKQILNIRSDDTRISQEQNDDIQKENQTDGGPSQACTAPVYSNRLSDIRPVFTGEVILNNIELLKKIGPKALSDGYARLLPWKVLCESFHIGHINIWCMIDQPSRLLLNKNYKTCPKNYIDIREASQATDVILWILRKELPPTYAEDSVSFILKETKNNFEICGMCNGSFASPVKSDVFSHKDINGQSQELTLKFERYHLQELMDEKFSESGETPPPQNKIFLWVALPGVFRAFKWRMIILNSNFTYLYFKDILYSIKYTDLVNIGRIAKKSFSTLVVRNQKMADKYTHKAFGIYFEPNYPEMIFVGPYPKSFKEIDIETLRYINKTLVCTQSFDKMRGKGDYTCGHWYIEKPHRPKQKIIDLTEEDPSDEFKVVVEESTKNVSIKKMRGTSSTEVEEQAPARSILKPKTQRLEVVRTSSPNVFLHNNEKVQIIDAPPRKPEDFNRYLITNIPHFGYLGAFQHLLSNEIDVSWPFENKVLRFRTPAMATEFLLERFSSLLQPIPVNFKIQIIVLTRIDLDTTHPIDAKVLSGYYICGEFGYYNIKALTEADAIAKVGMPKDDILRIFMKRAQHIVKKRLIMLASIVDVNPSDAENAENVLKTAKELINKLKEEETVHLSLKNKLNLKKRSNAIKVFRLLESLPPEIRNKECMQLRSIISNTGTIEIADSDDDEKAAVDTEKTDDSNKKRNYQTAFEKYLSPVEKPASVRQSLDSVKSMSSSSESATTTSSSSESSPEKPSKSITKNIPKGRVIQGVKIVKTSSGNLVMVSDSPETIKSSLKAGTHIIIKNNKIQSLSKSNTPFIIDKFANPKK